MTDRYVGPGGNDGNSGLTWALRKLTLNGVEDTPVVAGDTVYVGPGIYREMLTVDVSGTSGNIITYIADVTGANTDGVGGLVRVTGSDDDDSLPNARSQVLVATAKNYRTYRGFYFGEVTGALELVFIDGSSTAITDIIFEQCVFNHGSSTTGTLIFGLSFYVDAGVTNIIVRNCFFMPSFKRAINFYSGVGEPTAVNVIVENCYFINSESGVNINNVNAIKVRGCTLFHCGYGVKTQLVTAGEANFVYDCRLIQNYESLDENGVNTITEDYNLFDGTIAGIVEGGNSIESFLPISSPMLLSGYKMYWSRDEVAGYNNNIYLADHESLTTDLFGMPRPGGSKMTRGALQYRGVIRDGVTYKTGPSSIRMDDASVHVIRVPITSNSDIKVTAFVQRETDYAGTGPQLAISSVGDTATDTDVNVADQFNRLEATITPLATDRWLQIELRSNNTATSGDYIVWFDDIKIATKSDIPTMMWATNEIVLFLFDINVKDPWLAAALPVVTTAPLSYSPTEALFHPMPGYYRQV